MHGRTLRAVVLLGCVLSSLVLSSQEQESDPKFSKASLAESEARTKKIERELRRRGDPEWAGKYYYGDGLGVNVSLKLAPDNGFVFTWHGCLGLYDLNYGDVSFTNGTVKLLFKFPNHREGFQGIAPELLPVRWGQRHYLIPADNVVEFTNAINSGMEPERFLGGRYGNFLLLQGDETKQVEGTPELPSEYAGYLLMTPIRAKIISVGQPSEKKVDKEFTVRSTPVVLDVGTSDRLKTGMELHVVSPKQVSETAKVESVGEHSATAVIKEFGDSDPVPAAGWELSTKLQ